MGTRADFYVGKNQTAEWIGSIALDGYREGIPESILTAVDEAAFRHEVESFLETRGDASFPCDGWPWPWDSSKTTDCSYWFFEGKVWEERYGEYRPCDLGLPDIIDFPDMSNLKRRPPFGPHSGLIVVSFPKAQE